MVHKEKTFEEMVAETSALMEAGDRSLEESRQMIERLEGERRRDEAQHRREMLDIMARKKTKEPKPVTPDFQQMVDTTNALLKRSEELDISQRRLLDEMAANPLEEQCDAIYAQVGRQLHALSQEEINEAEEANRFLKEDEQSDEAEDALEKSGQPPPLQS